MAPPREPISAILVPCGLGATFHGLSRGTASLVSAGILDKLQDLGHEIKTYEPLDRPIEGSWSSAADISANGVRDENVAVEINHKVKNSVIESLKDHTNDNIPFSLVLGGVCSQCPAIMSGLQQGLTGRKVGVIWYDADADLSLPHEGTNVLATMAFSHMALREGCLESMKQFANSDGTSGVSNPSNTVLFGLETTHQAVIPRPHLTWLIDQHYRIFSSSAISKSVEAAERCAKAAIAYLTSPPNVCDFIVVNFDIDAIDAADYPLGNIPHTTGITFEQAMATIKVFMADARVKGLNLTEMNPDRDTGLRMTTQLVDQVVEAFAARASAIAS